MTHTHTESRALGVLICVKHNCEGQSVNTATEPSVFCTGCCKLPAHISTAVAFVTTHIAVSGLRFESK
jgi:hypothetical protein